MAVAFDPRAVLRAVAAGEVTRYFGVIQVGGESWIFTGHWAIRCDREPDRVAGPKDCRDWETKPPLDKVLAGIDVAAAKPVERTAREVPRPAQGTPAIIYAGDGIEVGVGQLFTGLLDACAEVRASGKLDPVLGVDAAGMLAAVVMPVRL